jgi:hypothetical protein
MLGSFKPGLYTKNGPSSETAEAQLMLNAGAKRPGAQFSTGQGAVGSAELMRGFRTATNPSATLNARPALPVSGLC